MTARCWLGLSPRMIRHQGDVSVRPLLQDRVPSRRDNVAVKIVTLNEFRLSACNRLHQWGFFSKFIWSFSEHTSAEEEMSFFVPLWAAALTSSYFGVNNAHCCFGQLDCFTWLLLDVGNAVHFLVKRLPKCNSLVGLSEPWYRNSPDEHATAWLRVWAFRDGRRRAAL